MLTPEELATLAVKLPTAESLATEIKSAQETVRQSAKEHLTEEIDLILDRIKEPETLAAGVLTWTLDNQEDAAIAEDLVRILEQRGYRVTPSIENGGDLAFRATSLADLRKKALENVGSDYPFPTVELEIELVGGMASVRSTTSAAAKTGGKKRKK